MLNETIRTLRKQNNLTQEQLAEKLNVSRQAITKWESGAGQPDIVNLKALAEMFDISLDALLSDSGLPERDNLSRTEFDLFGKNDIELDFGTVESLDITLGDIEKILVEIRTDLSDKAYHLVKVKLENSRGKDIASIKLEQDKKYLCEATGKPLSKQEAKRHLFVRVILPAALSDKIELSGDAENLTLHDFREAKHIEFDGKAHIVVIRGMKGHLELSSGADMEIRYDGTMEQLDINQLSAISTLYLSRAACVNVYDRGRSCNLVFDGYENQPDAIHQVELNGRKTEMTVKSE